MIFATSLFGAGIAALSLSSLFGFTRVLGLLPFVLLLIAGIVYQRRDQMQAADLKRARARSVPVEPNAPLAADLTAAGAAAAAQVRPGPTALNAPVDAPFVESAAAQAPAPVEDPGELVELPEGAIEEPQLATPRDYEPPAEAPSALNPAV